MQTYIVVWEIEVEAETALAAAKSAELLLSACFQEESRQVYKVTNIEQPEITYVVNLGSGEYEEKEK